MLSDGFQPGLVRTIGSEVIAMPLDRQPGVSQDFRESDAEIAVGEEDRCHAARSKTTASSTAFGESS